MTTYDTDIAAWAEEQATLLRERASNALDWDNLAEEIEGVAGSERKEIRSRLRVLCMHLLKWQYQPERRSRSWRTTIDSQRDDLDDVLEHSPSLRPYAGEALLRAYGRGRKKAIDQTGVERIPEACPWTINEILDPEFWPGGKEL